MIMLMVAGLLWQCTRTDSSAQLPTTGSIAVKKSSFLLWQAPQRQPYSPYDANGGSSGGWQDEGAEAGLRPEQRQVRALRSYSDP